MAAEDARPLFPEQLLADSGQVTEDIAIAFRLLCNSAKTDKARAQRLEVEVARLGHRLEKTESEKRHLLEKLQLIENTLAQKGQEDAQQLELLKQENSQLQQRLSQCGYENTVRTYECKVLSRRLDEATSRAKHAEASAVILGTKHEKLGQQLASLGLSITGALDVPAPTTQAQGHIGRSSSSCVSPLPFSNTPLAPPAELQPIRTTKIFGVHDRSTPGKEEHSGGVCSSNSAKGPMTPERRTPECVQQVRAPAAAAAAQASRDLAAADCTPAVSPFGNHQLALRHFNTPSPVPTTHTLLPIGSSTPSSAANRAANRDGGAGVAGSGSGSNPVTVNVTVNTGRRSSSSNSNSSSGTSSLLNSRHNSRHGRSNDASSGANAVTPRADITKLLNDHVLAAVHEETEMGGSSSHWQRQTCDHSAGCEAGTSNSTGWFTHLNSITSNGAPVAHQNSTSGAGRQSVSSGGLQFSRQSSASGDPFCCLSPRARAALSRLQQLQQHRKQLQQQRKQLETLIAPWTHYKHSSKPSAGAGATGSRTGVGSCARAGTQAGTHRLPAGSRPAFLYRNEQQEQQQRHQWK